jgi:hypothetical protein
VGFEDCSGPGFGRIENGDSIFGVDEDGRDVSATDHQITKKRFKEVH